MSPVRLFLTLACLLALLLPSSVQAETAAGAPVYFPETGHTLGYAFRHHFDRLGGIEVFGLPISEVFLEQGRPVQYFERARLEWHAPLARVQAGLLGRWLIEGREAEAPFQPLSSAPANAQFFTQTGHSLRGAFLEFWQANRGLANFGYPLSEEFVELNPQDGRSYTVQYFERARFEYHPENPAPYRVQLGHLGRQYLAANPAPEWALRPVQRAEQAWDGIRPTRIRLPRIGIDTAIVEQGFSLGEWDVPRYTAAHYWPISGFPGTAGNIIIAGHVGYRGIIFNSLPAVRSGDELLLNVGQSERRYVVREVLTVLPTETWVMQPTASETVTLITCVPIGVYSHRLIVRATPADG